MSTHSAMISVVNVRKGAFDATTAGIAAHIITYEMALVSYSMSHPAQQVVPVSQQPSS